ncbi:type II toxin-antitoxin system RelE family toxin [Streptococcus merionis]|uniref:type II toxin-antitoxin system RelE family toxin n=1 Tax=Streptococcus merionis TaxID=400065 RepID=UPI003512AC60
MKFVQIFNSKTVRKQIKKLDRQRWSLLFVWIDKHLEGTKNPRANSKHASEWCSRIGAYHLICDIQDDKMVILALEFGDYQDIY